MIINDLTKQKMKEIWMPFIQLIVMIVCITIIYPFFPSFWTIIIVVALFETTKQILQHKFKLKNWAKGMLVMTITLYITLRILKWSAKWGILGFILVCVALALWRLFGSKTKRKAYVESLKDIERQMYGHSLDELKNMKDERD